VKGARGAFLRLWFVLFLSFLAAELLFTIVVLGWIDLRPEAFVELLFVPSTQAVAFWAITRRRRLVGVE